MITNHSDTKINMQIKQIDSESIYSMSYRFK